MKEIALASSCYLCSYL